MSCAPTTPTDQVICLFAGLLPNPDMTLIQSSDRFSNLRFLSMYVCMYACVCVCVCVYICIHTYIWVCVRERQHTRIRIVSWYHWLLTTFSLSFLGPVNVQVWTRHDQGLTPKLESREHNHSPGSCPSTWIMSSETPMGQVRPPVETSFPPHPTGTGLGFS